jgi:hypothetical protein
MSKVVKAVVGVALIALSFIPGFQFLLPIGASLVFSALTTPGTPSRQAAMTTLQLGEMPRQAVFGQALVGGSLLDGFNYGGKNGTQWEVLVITIADHLCDALVGFYVNDKYVAFGGSGLVPGYSSQLKVTWHPGTMAQAADPTCTSYGGWSSADRLAGVAYVVVEYKADDSDDKSPTWPGGRPRFAWLVRGKRCYDPRKDSTVAGGSGAHRWASPSTWEWSENLAICRYNWVRGVYAGDQIDQPTQLLVGRGLSAIEAPPERVAAAANLCDELVPLAGGGSEPRYRVGAIVGADETFVDVEEKWAAACAGVLIQPEGSIEIEPGHAKSPVASFTDADLIVGKAVTFSDFRSQADEEWCNTVVARYIEPIQKWAEHAAPVRRVPADLVADGGPREKPLRLDYVTSGTQAQRVGEIARRMGRLTRTAGVTLGPRFNELEEGDWVVWTSARRMKGASRTFRVEGYSDDASWQKTLQLREISAGVFAWTTADQLTPGAAAHQQAEPGAIGAPGAGSWSLAAVQLTHGDATAPALAVTGASDEPYAELIRFEYLPAAGVADPATAAGWREAVVAGPGVTRHEVAGVAPQTAYLAGVSYIVGGVAGPRLVLGPVTTGGAVAADEYGVALATRLATLASDGVLSAGGEKASAIIDKDAMQGDFEALEARFLALGSPGDLGGARIAASTKLGALNGYLTGLTPAWNDRGVDTPIVAATWSTRWTEAYTAIAGYRAAITGRPGADGDDGAPGTDGYTVSLSTYVMRVALDAAGATKTGELPQGATVRVLRGATDVTAACAFSPSFSPSLAGSMSGAAVTLSTASADGTIDIAVTHAGVALQAQRIKVTTQRDNAPPSSVGIASGPLDATVGTTTYDNPSAKSVVLQPNTSGAIRFFGGGSYAAATSGNTSITLAGKGQYRLVGTTSWADMGAEVAGSQARYRPADGPDPGAISIDQTVTGLTVGANYEMRFTFRITQAGGMSATGIAGGQMTAVQP